MSYQAQPVYNAQVPYNGPQVAYGQPLVAHEYQVPVGIPVSAVPVAVPLSLPQPSDRPAWDGKAKDVWAAILFWIHVLCILGVAFALGVPAIRDDAAQPYNQQRSSSLDLNTSLIITVVATSTVVSAVVSTIAFSVLRRFGGALIKISLYIALFTWVVVAAAMFAVNIILGIFFLIPVILIAIFIRLSRNRIPFAAAHLQAACDATATHSSLFIVALVMLVVQGLWNITWAAAALGVDRKLNPTTSATSGAPTTGNNGNSGTIALFLLLVSYYWGASVIANVVHYVSSAVVGSWWFVSAPESPVFNALKRALTVSFGSIALGSLIIAILRALEAMARGAERQAIKDGRPAAAFVAACLLCLVKCARGIAEVITHWALIYCALTGESLWDGGRDALKLFTNRGWSLVVNDDLVGIALGITNLMVAGISAAIAAGTCFTLASSSDRALVAALAAIISFVMGFMASAIMTSILASATRTVFVAFAMNPLALQATHPKNLNQLASAWAIAHPDIWSSCGYASAIVIVPV